LLATMLLNQLRCSAGSSAFWGARDGFVVSRPRLPRSVTSLQVRATTSEQQPSAGWLQSVASKIGQVGSLLEKRLHGVDVAEPTTPAGDTVTYVGTAVIMKKLQVLDIMDRVADMQDDASEVLGGKHVSVQLISTEINPSRAPILATLTNFLTLVTLSVSSISWQSLLFERFSGLDWQRQGRRS
jgi:lipoxygenase